MFSVGIIKKYKNLRGISSREKLKKIIPLSISFIPRRTLENY